MDPATYPTTESPAATASQPGKPPAKKTHWSLPTQCLSGHCEACKHSCEAWRYHPTSTRARFAKQPHSYSLSRYCGACKHHFCKVNHVVRPDDEDSHADWLRYYEYIDQERLEKLGMGSGPGAPDTPNHSLAAYYSAPFYSSDVFEKSGREAADEFLARSAEQAAQIPFMLTSSSTTSTLTAPPSTSSTGNSSPAT